MQTTLTARQTKLLTSPSRNSVAQMLARALLLFTVFATLAGCDDEQAPIIVVAPLPASTTLSEVTVKGSVYDSGSSRHGLRLRISVNNQTPVAVPFSSGLFRHDVALRAGDNTILVEAVDGDGNRTKEQVAIYRRSLPELVHIYPASGAITTEQKIVLGGEFISAWAYPETRLLVDDELIEDSQQVHYQANGASTFGIEKPLVLGLNVFKLQVVNPDGQVTQFVQVIRQAVTQPNEINMSLDQSEGQLFESATALLSGIVAADIADLTAISIQFATDQSEQIYTTQPTADGHFSAEVALALGDNRITVVARHAAGALATKQVVVKRVSQGMFVDVMPNGETVLEQTPITIYGEIQSAWPLADTQFFINGNSYPLTDMGELYHFSVGPLPLVVGVNLFNLSVTTPDGTRSKLLTLTYQPGADVTPPTLELFTTASVTTAASVKIRGRALDPGANSSGIASVRLNNAMFADVNFVATRNGDEFSAEVPLVFGSNPLTITAADLSGNVTNLEHSITRNRTAAFRSLSPVNDALVTTATITVSGEVVVNGGGTIDSVLVNERRVAATPLAETGVYAFSAENISLNIGMNTLTLSATGAEVNTVTEQLNIEYRPTDISNIDPPELSITAPMDGATLSSDSFSVTGKVVSFAGAVTVTVNGTAVPAADLSSYRLDQQFHAKFRTVRRFAAGSQSMQLDVEVTDSLGQQTGRSLTVYRDQQLPVIALDDYLPVPAVNRVASSSLLLNGVVTDDNISSVTLNDVPIMVTPTTTPHQYRFSGQLDLPVGTEQAAQFAAYDIAGNRVTQEYRFQSTASVGLSALLPPANAEFLVDGQPLPIQVAARTSELPAGARVVVWYDHADAVVLAQAETVASGEVNLPASAAEYTLSYAVIDASNQILAQTSRTIRLLESAQVATALLRHEPAHLAVNVEPNKPVELYFNKAIDPSKLTIQVRETLHGKTYINSDAPGTNFPYAKGYTLQAVARDRDSVALSIDVLPGNQTIAIYPDRVLGYAALVEVEAQYDGVDIGRFRFNTRPLPTFIRGGVSDSFGQPLAGITVELPALGRATTTNADGAYAFGFQEQGGQEIPSGTYDLIVNGNLTASGLGSDRLKVTIEGHRDNQLSMIPLAPLNPSISFVPLQSGDGEVILASGELTMDLTNAQVLFPSGYDRGRVHVQFTPAAMLAGKVDPQVPPIWAYAFQPKGVNIEGNVSLSIKMPAMRGGYDYIPDGDAYMLILGFNPQTGVISPIGVGQLDSQHALHSRGALSLRALDYISVSWVPMAQQALAAEVANGQRSLFELTAAISSQFAQ